MFTWLKTKWLWFWHNAVQKTTAWLIGTMVTVDVTGLAEPIKGLVGPKKYYGVVVAAAVVNAARAHMAKAVSPPAPPPTLPPAA
jgi:hypothetical protein